MATQKKQPEPVPIPIAWSDDPDLRTIHANHLWLSRQEGDIFLTFGELPPVKTPGSDKLPDRVFIRPVARISLSPEALARMAKLLQDNVQTLDSQRAGA